MRLVALVVLAACGSKPADRDQIRVAPPEPGIKHIPGRVVIEGHVLVGAEADPIGGVKLVLRGSAGELETSSSSDGSYAITVPPGAYHVFVRDDRVMTVGLPDRVRVDSGPRGVFAKRVDESLAPVFLAETDATNVDLMVVRVARLQGRVIDFDGRTVSHAIVRASGGPTRPVLGTDVVETDDAGELELRLPEGRFAVDVSHPSYASTAQRLVVVAHSAFPARTTLEIDPGCVISGRVIGPQRGAIASDGAIEREVPTVQRFGPASRIEPDGTFRFSTLEETSVTLRAWPWKTRPSQTKTFACHSGKRFTEVTFDVTEGAPELAGTIVDASGAPVPFAYLDVRSLESPALPGQQERADAHGAWSVYDLLPGKYQITATAPGRGIAVAEVVAPATTTALALGGVGRIAGTVALGDGAFEAVLASCGDAFDAQQKPMPIAHEPRLVQVTGGRFVIDDVPACHLQLLARWHGEFGAPIDVDIAAGHTTLIELPLDVPRKKKSITGVVRDASDHTVNRAHVTAAGESVFTDEDGRFALHALPGTDVLAAEGTRVGHGVVGLAAIDSEQIDVTIADQ